MSNLMQLARTFHECQDELFLMQWRADYEEAINTLPSKMYTEENLRSFSKDHIANRIEEMLQEARDYRDKHLCRSEEAFGLSMNIYRETERWDDLVVHICDVRSRFPEMDRLMKERGF